MVKVANAKKLEKMTCYATNIKGLFAKVFLEFGRLL